MGLDSQQTPKIIQINLELSQYPILARRIRNRMREELVSRGMITSKRLEEETRERALESQIREGLANPLLEEPGEIWQLRLDHFRDSLTDFYFAYNLPHDLFIELVNEVVSERAPQVRTSLS